MSRPLRPLEFLAFGLALGQIACAEPPQPARSSSNPPHGATMADAAKADVPDALLVAVKADLAARRQVAVDDIRLLSSESLLWRDLSLGCGKPNELYAQVEVPGYRILLEAGGRQFDYRARDGGPFILCEAGLPAARAR
jgi:hypothetical protein